MIAQWRRYDHSDRSFTTLDCWMHAPHFLDHMIIGDAPILINCVYSGRNENGHRKLRRFLPKGTDFSKLKPKELQRIEDWVNNYPRKIFGYKSANDMYAAMI